jgi:hypothetical protein
MHRENLEEGFMAQAGAVLTNRGLTLQAAAEYAGMPLSTLRNLVYADLGPTTYVVGRRRFVRLADLEAWLASRPTRRPAKVSS